MGYRHQEAVRGKIQASHLVTRLYKIAMGEIEAKPEQINAAKTLLNKVLPDLQSVQVDASVETTQIVNTIELIPLKDERNSTDSPTH